MPYHFFDQAGDVGVTLTGPTPDLLFRAAAEAFSDTITAIDTVEPKRPQEVALAAPELDRLLVDFLSELLYRFDTRAWLTREAELVVRPADGGWGLEGTLRGERFNESRHCVKAVIKAVTYRSLEVHQHDDLWRATVVFDV
jgi:SHS2 domain-containing protein